MSFWQRLCVSKAKTTIRVRKWSKITCGWWDGFFQTLYIEAGVTSESFNLIPYTYRKFYVHAGKWHNKVFWGCYIYFVSLSQSNAQRKWKKLKQICWNDLGLQAQCKCSSNSKLCTVKINLVAESENTYLTKQTYLFGDIDTHLIHSSSSSITAQAAPLAARSQKPVQNLTNANQIPHIFEFTCSFQLLVVGCFISNGFYCILSVTFL